MGQVRIIIKVFRLLTTIFKLLNQQFYHKYQGQCFYHFHVISRMPDVLYEYYLISFYVYAYIYYLQNMKACNLVALILALLVNCAVWKASCRPVVVNGGEVTINGAITGTQIDIMVNYTANVKWLAVIFSKDQVNTDLHLLKVDPTNNARPVEVRDCHLDQNSHITYDDVNNIQPSVTSFAGSVSFGLKVAYNRDLNTGDMEDKRFYPDDVIQLCFMSSTSDFVGGGFEYGNEKICSFFSLHTEFDYYQDRLLGNWAATTLFGGSNLTVYATQSTDEGTFEPWLFVGVVHKQQGLNPYTGRWIGITYEDSLTNTDMTVVEYGFRDSTTQVHILDMYIRDPAYAADDYDYATLQGGDDVTENLGGVNATKYMVALYKRKLSTGDTNRDNIVTSGQNQFCFILGNSFAFTTFTYTERVCLELNLQNSYYSNFRISEDQGDSVIEYVDPPNTVVVLTCENMLIITSLLALIVAFLSF